MNFVAGAQFSTGPSLVLAPESALSLLPSRGLSSAPAVCSVSAMAVLSNRGTKKELEYRSAFRHGGYQAGDALHVPERNEFVVTATSTRTRSLCTIVAV